MGREPKATAHDIRQPLNALRLNLRSIARDDARQLQVTDVECTLSDLESLVSENLSDALLLHETTEPEQTDIGSILLSAVDMFDAKAKEKSIRLRAVSTSKATSVPALAPMRIVTNLVANAIRATDRGAILIDMRHTCGLRLEVHDTGCGLKDVQFSTATDPHSDTFGRGLGTVAQLCREDGMRFEHIETADSGTILQIWLPREGHNMG